jgi:inhibitor of KinA sporulation pathway (predicted exonuclease)
MKDKDSFRTDRLLVVDLELTCWESQEPPEGEHPDIIEIGIAEVDNGKLEVLRRGRFLVRPERSRLGEFCSRLTGITPGELGRHGRPFREVCRSIDREWAPRHKTWAAWGKDAIAMEEAASFHGVGNPFSASHLDLGHLYDLFSGSPQRVGLVAAMGSLGLEQEGEQHRAEDDAAGAARVYIELAKRLRGGIG